MNATNELKPEFSIKVYSGMVPYDRLKRSVLEKRMDLRSKGFEFKWDTIFDLNELNLENLIVEKNGFKFKIKGYEKEYGILKTGLKKGPDYFNIKIYPFTGFSEIKGNYQKTNLMETHKLNEHIKELQNIINIELKYNLVLTKTKTLL
jgi:hypothetical protein